jgi:hypothetical protein
MLIYSIDGGAARLFHTFGFDASPLRFDQLLILLKDTKRLVWQINATQLNTSGRS